MLGWRRGGGIVMPFAKSMEVDFDERQFIRQELSRATGSTSWSWAAIVMVWYWPMFPAKACRLRY